MIVPTGPPQAVEVRSESSTTLTLSWQPPAPENQNGIILHYIVNITEMETGIVFSYTAVNSTILTVPALHPFYNYTCIVAAVTVGVGPYSAPAVIQMPEDGKHAILIFLIFAFLHCSTSPLLCSTIKFSSDVDFQQHYRLKLLSSVAEPTCCRPKWNNSLLLS